MYPALAVAQTLTSGHPDVECVWIGSPGGMEVELVQRAGVAYVGVPAGAIHGVGLAHLARSAWALARGLWQALGIMRRARPQALLVTGGYVGLPAALAAWIRRVPIMALVPDVEPGWALRLMGRLASKVALAVEPSRQFFRHQGQHLLVTGYPVRQDLVPIDRSVARQSFGLQPDVPVVLIMGGSRGAHSLNAAVLAILPELLSDVQVLHVSGSAGWEDVQRAQASLSPAAGARYRAFEYLHGEMAAALSAADVAVSRAGASTLGEYPRFGLPAVLVPYPFAWRYQHVNADFLVERGAAVRLDDSRLNQALLSTVRGLLRDAPRLERMRAAARALAAPDAARRIAEVFYRLGQDHGRGRQVGSVQP